MRKAIGWTLLIMTGFALWYSWPATIIMGIIDFIAFIVAVRTSPITENSAIDYKNNMEECNEPFDIVKAQYDTCSIDYMIYHNTNKD